MRKQKEIKWKTIEYGKKTRFENLVVLYTVWHCFHLEKYGERARERDSEEERENERFEKKALRSWHRLLLSHAYRSKEIETEAICEIEINAKRGSEWKIRVFR